MPLGGTLPAGADHPESQVGKQHNMGVQPMSPTLYACVLLKDEALKMDR